MNRWQIVFLGLGAVALALILSFPPQFSLTRSVEYLPVWYDNPVDWFRLFFWIVVVLLITGLGITANKSDHYR